jgi:hypothetical protein
MIWIFVIAYAFSVFFAVGVVALTVPKEYEDRLGLQWLMAILWPIATAIFCGMKFGRWISQ